MRYASSSGCVRQAAVMSDLSPTLREELSEVLRNNDGQLGKVFVLLESGAVSNRTREGGAAANTGVASKES